MHCCDFFNGCYGMVAGKMLRVRGPDRFVQCLCRGMPMQFWSKLYGSVLVFLFIIATAVFAAEELAALRDRAERGDAQA